MDWRQVAVQMMWLAACWRAVVCILCWDKEPLGPKIKRLLIHDVDCTRSLSIKGRLLVLHRFYGTPNLNWVSISPLKFLYQGIHQVVFNWLLGTPGISEKLVGSPLA